MRSPLKTAPKGIAALEVVFSLPVILLCIGITVYVGTMMKARIELLSVVQQTARLCSIGQNTDTAQACVAAQQAAIEARVEAPLERCDNLNLEQETFARSASEYSQFQDANGNTLGQRNEVSLDLMFVRGACDVIVKFPLRFVEFNLLQFSINESAAMPFRVERTNLP